MPINSTTLILAPHTDDGELGCGATIAKYVSQGRNVIYAAFSICDQSLPKDFAPGTLKTECRAATEILGVKETLFFDFEVRRFDSARQEILEILVQLKKKYQPQTIFLPAKNDLHQDHQVIYSEGLRAFKHQTILGYELCWNNTTFQPTLFISVTEEQLQTKIAALKCYASQKHRTYMQKDFQRSLATVRGVQCSQQYAEAFEVYRMQA